MIRSTKGKGIIERLPKDRVLTETDGPFIKIQGRSAKPVDVNSVLAYLADVWCSSVEKVAMQVESNFGDIMSPSDRKTQ
jgi:TatD DNase family protein